MSHDHPLDPYRNESQALLNIIRLFDIRVSSQLPVKTYRQLGDERHLWTFESAHRQYMLLVDGFIASAADEIATLTPFVETASLYSIPTINGDDVAETNDFRSAVLYEYKEPTQ